MTGRILNPTNGSSPASTGLLEGTSSASPLWLQQTTRQFFSGVNWDGQSPAVQELRRTRQSGSTEPLSLALSVSQFFGAINWDRDGAAPSEPLFDAFPDSSSAPEALTLDDFSDLF